MFDLYLLPINIQNKKESQDVPGLWAASAPRRAQRSRSGDVLLMLITIVGGANPDEIVLQRMYDTVLNSYYEARGSLTSGLRQAAEDLNKFFIQYNNNLKGSRVEDQIFGLLNLAVVRQDLIYFLHSGPTHSYLVSSDGTQDYHDPVPENRGLGFGRSINLSYYQTKVNAGDVVVFCAVPSPGWNERTLQGGQRISMNLLRRRMISQADTDLKAVIIQFKPGTQGVVRKLKPRGSVPSTQPTRPEIAQKAEGSPQAESPQPRTERDSLFAPQGETESEPEVDIPQDDYIPEPLQARKREMMNSRENQAPEKLSQAQTQRETSPEQELAQEGNSQEEAAEEVLPETKPSNWSRFAGMLKREDRAVEGYPPSGRPKRELQTEPEPKPQENAYQTAVEAAKRQSRRKAIANTWLGFSQEIKSFTERIKTFFLRLIPDATEDSPQINTVSMLAIAILIPLIVVAFASTIYVRNGRTSLHRVNLEEAHYYLAESQSEPEVEWRRRNLQQAVYWLDIANTYGESDEADELSDQIYQALDQLDGITRLEFSPVMTTNFAATVNISRIVANDTEVYLLNENDGRIIRMFKAGNRYDLDEYFECNPGTLGELYLGDVVDLIALPPGFSTDAAVMGVDENGKFMYCYSEPNKKPMTSRLDQPDEGYELVSDIFYNQGFLYVMDKEKDNVYLYSQSKEGFDDDAYSYFDLKISDAEKDLDPEDAVDVEAPDLEDVIDFAVSGDDLYFLNSDNTVTKCHSMMFSDIQAKCEAPVPFGDLRPGFEEIEPTFDDSIFAQLTTAHLPDPSVFMLDSSGAGLYRFSLQMNLDKVIMPTIQNDPALPDEPVTAFAVSPTRVIFLAYGNQVFFANLP